MKRRAMHVLMTADCIGGVWSHAIAQCRALAEHGVHVTLVVSGRAMSAAQRAQADSLPNVSLHARPLKCEWMPDPWADVAAAGEWLEELVAEAQPDVVHLNDYAHGGRHLGGLPRIVVGHSCVLSWFAAVRGRPAGQEWDAYRQAVADGLEGADEVVAPTAWMLSELRRHYAWRGEGRVIHNGLPPSPLPGTSADAREPFILCGARLWDEAKNAAALAQAAEGMAWPVRLAGECENPAGGESICLDNVQMLGPLPHDQLMNLMGRAAIYALPAKYEPFGLSALEAAQAGCALVLGDIPSLREVWDDAAVYVEPGDVAGLHEALDHLIDNDGIRHSMARRAQERSKKYSAKAMAMAYVRLYQELLQSGAGADQVRQVAAT